MPKSRNRRKGKNRPRRQGALTFVQMVGGQPIRFVTKLPPAAHPDRLDEELGDDAQAKLVAFVEAGVSPEDRDRFASAFSELPLSDIQDLGGQLAARYSVQASFERVTGLSAHDMPQK